MLIGPGIGFPALKHGRTENVGLAVSNMFIWNVLDLVAGVIPVTVVKED